MPKSGGRFVHGKKTNLDFHTGRDVLVSGIAYMFIYIFWERRRRIQRGGFCDEEYTRCLFAYTRRDL